MGKDEVDRLSLLQLDLNGAGRAHRGLQSGCDVRKDGHRQTALVWVTEKADCRLHICQLLRRKVGERTERGNAGHVLDDLLGQFALTRSSAVVAFIGAAAAGGDELNDFGCGHDRLLRVYGLVF